MGIFAGVVTAQPSGGLVLVDTQGPENLRDDGLPEFYDAGDAAAGDVQCATCGYGVSTRTLLPPCPMCGGRVWERLRASALVRSDA